MRRSLMVLLFSTIVLGGCLMKERPKEEFMCLNKNTLDIIETVDPPASDKIWYCVPKKEVENASSTTYIS